VQEASRDALQRSGVFGAGVPLVTQIVPAATFWHAALASHTRASAQNDAILMTTMVRSLSTPLPQAG
jgi:hypothetical protein